MFFYGYEYRGSVWSRPRVTIHQAPRHIRLPTSFYGTLQCTDMYVRSRPTMIYFERLQTVCFFRLFTREGDMEYTGCGNTDHRGLKARVLPWLPSCPDELEKRCRWACFVLWWKLKRARLTQGLSKTAQLQATVNYSCLCSLHFVILNTYAKQCQNSVYNLCGMEGIQMPLPGSWIYATDLLKSKFKALNTLLHSAEYTISRKRVFLFQCLKILLGHSSRWTLCNHHEQSCFSLFPLYPSILLGLGYDAVCMQVFYSKPLFLRALCNQL